MTGKGINQQPFDAAIAFQWALPSLLRLFPQSCAVPWQTVGHHVFHPIGFWRTARSFMGFKDSFVLVGALPFVAVLNTGAAQDKRGC
jgi:hypothetical protein